MGERRIVKWTPAAGPSALQIRVGTAVAAKAPLAALRVPSRLVMGQQAGSRARVRVLGLGCDFGWQLLYAGRVKTLQRIYDPEAEIAWRGARKPLGMPDRFTGHAELLENFALMRELASANVDMAVRPVEFFDAGGPCFAARLQLASKWSRSSTVIEEEAATVYTLADGLVARQSIIWEHGVDLAAELGAALDAAVA